MRVKIDEARSAASKTVFGSLSRTKACAPNGKSCTSFSVATCVLTSSMDGPGVKIIIFFVRVFAVSLHVEPELFWNSQKALELCFRVWLAVANSSFFKRA